VSRNLLLKELRLNRASFLAWALSLMALIVFTAAAMPAWISNTAAMSAYMKALPKALLNAMSVDLERIGDPLSVFVVYCMLYTTLLGGLYAIGVFARTLHKEQAQHTAEFLMAKPLSRWDLFATKAAASLLQVLAMAALVSLTGFLCMAAFVPQDWSRAAFFTASLYQLLLMIAFGAMGLLVSLCAKRARSLTGPAMGIVLGFYLYDAACKMNDSYAWLAWLGPFKWMDTAVSAPGYGLEAWRVFLFLGVTAACLASSWLIYRRKDILG